MSKYHDINNIKFVVNTIAFVPHPKVLDGESSDDETDGKFSESDFDFDPTDKTSLPFRTFRIKKKDAESKEDEEEETKYPTKLGKVSDVEEEFLKDSGEKASVVVQPFLSQLKAEAFVDDDIERLADIKVSIGLNRPKSLSTRKNKILTNELESKVDSTIEHEKFGVFWNYSWYNKDNKSTTYDKVHKFYKQLKKVNSSLADQFREASEVGIVPYQALRERVKSHDHTKALIKSFRDINPEFDIYLSIIDSDTVSFNNVYSAYLRIYESSSPTVMSTGYEFSKVQYPFMFASQIDRAIRIATAKYIPLGVYYPEPNMCVLIPKESDTIPESFISVDNDLRRKGNAESVALLRQVKDREGATFVFADAQPLITAVPERATKTKKSKTKIKFSDKFLEGGLPTTSDITLLKQISQSHFLEGVWLDNLYINRAIAITGNFYHVKGLITRYLKTDDAEDLEDLKELEKHLTSVDIVNIKNAWNDREKIIEMLGYHCKVEDILESLISEHIIEREELLGLDLKQITNLLNQDGIDVLQESLIFPDVLELYKWYQTLKDAEYAFSDIVKMAAKFSDQGEGSITEFTRLYTEEGIIAVRLKIEGAVELAIEIAPKIAKKVIDAFEGPIHVQCVLAELEASDQDIFRKNLGEAGFGELLVEPW